MMITAAGTVAPAKGLVIGAGVAGLQAIATARRMGAVMFGYDVRPAVGEQVRSLGASFVEPQVVVAEAEHASGYAKQLSAETQQRERDTLGEHVAAVDFVITTAAVPGRPAPKIVTEAMVAGMRPGSVIVDIAAETGGNCALTRPGETVIAHGVAIHGPLGLPSSIPVHASQMYARNIGNFLLHVVGNDGAGPDFDDDITMASCITPRRPDSRRARGRAGQGPPRRGRQDQRRKGHCSDLSGRHNPFTLSSAGVSPARIEGRTQPSRQWWRRPHPETELCGPFDTPLRSVGALRANASRGDDPTRTRTWGTTAQSYPRKESTGLGLVPLSNSEQLPGKDAAS